jgi:hypothetical protein
MEYGNNWRTIRNAAVFGAALGPLLVVALIIGATVTGKWGEARPGYLLVLLLVPVAGSALPVALTACLRVRVKGRAVQHVLFGKFVLAERPLSQLERVEGEGLALRLRLRFEGGKKMRLLGMRPQEQARMSHDLEWLAAAARREESGCLRGHPKPPLRPELLRWEDGTIPKLVRAASEGGLGSLPILADALEEAGCADAELMAHLRRPGGHEPDCRALALLRAAANQLNAPAM